MKKAKFINCTYDKYTGEKFLFYEYKGYEYMIFDNGWKMSPYDALYLQHKREQKNIDEIIKNKKMEKNKENYKNNNDVKSVDEILDELLEYWDK